MYFVTEPWFKCNTLGQSVQKKKKGIDYVNSVGHHGNVAAQSTSTKNHDTQTYLPHIEL